VSRAAALLALLAGLAAAGEAQAPGRPGPAELVGQAAALLFKRLDGPHSVSVRSVP
jgi:hypothetical protein